MTIISTQAFKLKTICLPIGLTILSLFAGFYGPTLIQSIKTSLNLINTTSFDKKKYCLLSTTTCQQDSVGIKLDTDIAKPLKTTQVHVDWPQNNSDRLMLTLRGLEMDLGVVKFPIKKQLDGNYSGTIILPICTDAKMTWIGTLTDQNQHTVYTSIRMEK